MPEQKPQVTAPMFSNTNLPNTNTNPLFSNANTFNNSQNPVSNASAMNPSVGLLSNAPPQKPISNEQKPQTAQNMTNPPNVNINVTQGLFQNPLQTGGLFNNQGKTAENKPVNIQGNIAAPQQTIQKPQIDLKAPVENQPQNNKPPPVTPSFNQNQGNIVFDQAKTNKDPMKGQTSFAGQEEQKAKLNMSPTEQRDKSVNQQDSSSHLSRESEQSAPQGEKSYPLIDGLKTKNKDISPQSFEQRRGGFIKEFIHERNHCFFYRRGSCDRK